MNALATPPNTRVMVIAGPTASGKSALALMLAERLGGTVINADSMQVYRGLPILTAQPDAAAQARAPHRLYGALDLTERCSAGRWRALAMAAIAEACAAGRVPIVVGGTGLYLRALMSGLADVPDIPADVRAAQQTHMTAVGPAAFHAELAARDPEMAARLRPSDRQRLVRAAEVLAATGRSLAEWQRDGEGRRPADLAGFDFCTVLLDPPREELYRVCDDRFRVMVAQGALDEAAAVAGRIAREGLPPDLPALKSLGLRELMAHLAGEMSLDAAVAAAQTATRRYAKRQVTWFKGKFISNFCTQKKLNERTLADFAKNIIEFFLTPRA